MKRILTLLLCIVLITGTQATLTYAAPEWPSNVSVEAEGAVLMDARSGAVIYGKNLHSVYYPASITKILTALIVIEHCNLDDIVTFSHDAIYNVEQGSSSAGLDVGDKMTVRDCLYAMLLKSANEVANALAEHTAGSVQNFAVLMNAKAKELGCQESHFNNPSGLNDENHYTTPYDIYLMLKEALKYPEFTEITLYGGGIGIPPMLQLSKELAAAGRKPSVFLGYRDSHLFLKEDFEKYSKVYVATEDGSIGTKGNVLTALSESGLQPSVMMACGPMMMLRAIRQEASERAIPAYISLEEHMACGIGACLGCVCRTTKKDEHSQVHNARICTEGPVFLAEEVEI